MAYRRVVLEIGMGTDIRGAEPTKAAVRALRDALWRNSLTIARALNRDTDSMRVEVTVGVPRPEEVDTQAIPRRLCASTCRSWRHDGASGDPGDGRRHRPARQ